MSPAEAPSGRALTWQSPSCSTWCELTVPVAVRHGFEPSRTVSWPGRCTPTSGLDGQLPPPAGPGGGGGRGHLEGGAVFGAVGGRVPPAPEGRSPRGLLAPAGHPLTESTGALVERSLI